MSNLSLCLSGWDNFSSDLKMYKEVQNLHTLMLLVFLLKLPGLWNLCPEVETKIDSQHAVKKVVSYAQSRTDVSPISKTYPISKIVATYKMLKDYGFSPAFKCIHQLCLVPSRKGK